MELERRHNPPQHMARPFKIEILEDAKYLEKSMRYSRNCRHQEKLQMLWWLKVGEVEQQHWRSWDKPECQPTDRRPRAMDN